MRLLDGAARAALAGWITLYKQWRGHLHTGRVWRGDAGDGIVWQAHGEPGDAPARQVLLLTYRVAPTHHRYTPTLRLPMLDSKARYRVRSIVPAGAAAPAGNSAPLLDALQGEGTVMDGAWLAQAGLPMPRSKAEVAYIVWLEAV